MTPLVRFILGAYVAAMAIVVIMACAQAKPGIRTALDIARTACDVFLGAQPEQERALGMSLDQCADHLLAGQQRVLAARRARPVIEP
jgi:hypothetical protein